MTEYRMLMTYEEGVIGTSRKYCIIWSIISSAAIIRTIKLRKMNCEGNVTCMGEKLNQFKMLAEKQEGKATWKA